MNTSRKKLATYDDFDRSDCVQTGFTWILYTDGRVTAESWSCWQGSRTGERWTTKPGACDTQDDHLTELESFAKYAFEECYLSQDGLDGLCWWSKTSNGHYIY